MKKGRCTRGLATSITVNQSGCGKRLDERSSTQKHRKGLASVDNKLPRQQSALDALPIHPNKRPPCRPSGAVEEALSAAAAHRHLELQPVQRQRVLRLLHAPEQATKCASMHSPEERAKEEGEGLSAALLVDEVDVENRPALQHARPSLRQLRHQHLHRHPPTRAMPRLRFRTVSRLYDISHHSMADFL